ncbi:Epoxyqueuosine reductase [Anoxybacillus sp. P3H1B]|jgi:epoxyqueuosine reductase|uniref:Epoxyqueuosine reductase n=1 Tax=Anoxybacteroides rupiense TaxID=311460 RepID=A0ABD5IYT5_9BACL|nr:MULTISPECIES: tRNA epoxyqueuosine(34) reductase QueG [Anoxybacillus]KXG09908.1 Epoxyqueuosine reductase [Anoxybacillus sp. P3H1B]MBS2771635.1 tRNA epoxyqueuosine(34) reductase QueG [Anoxybacillus rupiensis]MED5053538.1 tRNA epoxyqueuosine(34) reductase QueG [Anoxybacillus rupiensis]QHC03061.1 tRNA epoxyqueuosine(34) reductase QueG [Anoxybacillus sp. PDR2]
MDVKKLKEDIIQYSQTIGIDKIGFASADPFVELKERLRLQQQLGYQSGFEEPDIEKRTDPALLLDEAKSIISIALAYPSKMKNAPRSTKEEKRGIFCRASWGTDYHIILQERLLKLKEFILERVPNAKVKSMVDTGELADRAVAERAGIGWSGKNCAIITPEFGSYVYLGEMITNIPFPPDNPIENRCGSCTKCLDACPTGALVQGGQLNAQRCIAFLTQTKGFIADEFREKIGNRLYGCDTCQTVCPENKGKDFHFHEEMEPDPEVVKPLLKPLLHMTNREFREKFGTLSGAWRGKKPIQRNAILALAHFQDRTAIPDLLKLLKEDSRPVIRGTAAWALGKIGDENVMPILEEALQIEKDEEVLREIKKGLQLLMNRRKDGKNQPTIT